MGRAERRKYTRLSIKLAVSHRRVDDTAGTSHRGYALNASPGGLYFQTPACGFKPGNLLQVELSVPPTAGIIEFGGRISGFAKVSRTERVEALTIGSGTPAGGYGVAVEFCQRPRLCM